MPSPARRRYDRLLSPFLLVAMLLAPAARAVASDPLIIVVPPDVYRASVGPEPLEGDGAVTLDIDVKGGLRCSGGAGERLRPIQRASCTLIARRDVFPPDFGKDGQAVPTRLRLVVRWQPDSSIGEFGGAIPISPQLWVTSSDYPLRVVLSGTTQAVFHVTEFGRVRDCRVSKSSGSLVLDAALCPLLQRRAAFLPALGAHDEPRPTMAEFAYRWPFG